jgi:hypothetical protein
LLHSLCKELIVLVNMTDYTASVPSPRCVNRGERFIERFDGSVTSLVAVAPPKLTGGKSFFWGRALDAMTGIARGRRELLPFRVRNQP